MYLIGNTTGPSVHKYSVASHQAQVCSQFLLFFVTPDVLLGAIFPPTAPLLYACTPLSPPSQSSSTQRCDLMRSCLARVN